MHATDLDYSMHEVLENSTYEIENGQIKDKTLKTPIKNLEGFNGKIVYDENGNLTSVFVTDVLDQIDYVDTYEYDSEGHLKRMKDGRNGYTRDVECDEDGNILEIRTYDSNGKLVMQQINTWYED